MTVHSLQENLRQHMRAGEWTSAAQDLLKGATLFLDECKRASDTDKEWLTKARIGLWWDCFPRGLMPVRGPEGWDWMVSHGVPIPDQTLAVEMLERALTSHALSVADWLVEKAAPSMEDTKIQQRLLSAAFMRSDAKALPWLAAHGVSLEPEGVLRPSLLRALEYHSYAAGPYVKALLDTGLRPTTAVPVGMSESPLCPLYYLATFCQSREDGKPLETMEELNKFRQLWTVLVEAGADPNRLDVMNEPTADKLLGTPWEAWYQATCREQKTSALSSLPVARRPRVRS